MGEKTGAEVKENDVKGKENQEIINNSNSMNDANNIYYIHWKSLNIYPKNGNPLGSVKTPTNK